MESHTVILPETLFYECYTDVELSDKKHFKRLEHLIKAGADLSYQLMQIIRDEGQNLRSCKSIIDYSWTCKLRSNGLRKEDIITKEEIANRKGDRSKMALSIKKLALNISQKLKSNNPDCLNEIRSLQMNRKERFRKWIEEAERDLMDIEYLAYLSKCNSFLTNDARLRDLAEVVFPNRTICSSIQEISS